MVESLLVVVGLWAQAADAKDPPATKEAPKAVAPQAPAKADKPPVAFPHPLVTEILFAVPKGTDGDADGDGQRSATGDEFVELCNPHDRPINLKGYVISDALPLKGPDSDRKPAAGGGGGKAGGDSRKAGSKKGSPGAAEDDVQGAAKEKPKRSQVKFVFPELVLKPGDVVVVFNGFESRAKGPVGDDKAAAGRNENFGNAYVFTMRVKTNFAAFSNTGDCVTLSAPDGTNVQCVRWGDVGEEKKVVGATVMDEAPTGMGSVQREGINGKFVSHRELEGALGQKTCSPGVFGARAEKALKDEAEGEEPAKDAVKDPKEKPAPKAK